MFNATPQIVATYNTSAMANRLEVFDGNKIAVSDWDDVEVLELNIDDTDWSDWTASLDLVGYKNTTRRTMAIAVKDNYIYSAEWASLQVFEFEEIEGADIERSAY